MTFRDMPKLNWLNGKTHSSSTGGGKNVPGRKQEQSDAIYENQFIDETNVKLAKNTSEEPDGNPV